MDRRKTEIQCSIGPSCETAEMIAEMIKTGMDVARINLSHGSAESQAEKLEAFRQACKQLGTDEPKIMYDICGPEVRIKELPDGPLEWSDGEIVVLPEVNYENFCDEVIPGTDLLIDDGKVRLEVVEIKGKDIVCKVLVGGTVQSRKGVNTPDIKLQMEYLNDRDKADIRWAVENGADYIAGSFIRRADDVRILRDYVRACGGENVGIIAKLENKESITNLEAIADEADQILVARGDMGVEIGFEKVPGVQKRLIRRCNELGKPVIVATQMLESMTHSPLPTRAEVSDVANAIYDGATSLLVTGETAAGDYPVEVVRELGVIIEQAELDLARYGKEIL